MPLLLEDGTGVAGANTYISIDDLRTYASNRGYAMPAIPTDGSADPAIAIFTPHIVIACDYLETLNGMWAGYPAVIEKQTLAFPRKGIFANSYELPLIPYALKAAQCQLVMEQLRGVILLPTQAAPGVGSLPNDANGAVAPAQSGFVTVDKLDVIETHYSETIGTGSRPIMPFVDALLRPLLYNGSSFLTTVRI